MTEPIVRPGQVWRKSDHERLRVTDLEGNSVGVVVHDDRGPTSAVSVVSLDEIRRYELVEEPEGCRGSAYEPS
jgi:hypothetical protein